MICFAVYKKNTVYYYYTKIKEITMDWLLTLLVTQVPFPVAMKPGRMRSNIHEEDSISKDSD